jgi:DNA modification methylase
MKKIAITCKAADLLPIDSLEDFQGKLKKISKKNLDKLKKRIIKDGINVPLFVWRVNDWCRILDGHQRLKALLSLRKDGYELPFIPVAYIEADNEEDAKQKLLGITSQFGEFEIEELSEWINEIDKDIAETLRFADNEIKIKIEDDYEEGEIEEIKEAKFIKYGDIIQLNNHKILCGDSNNKNDIEKIFKNKKADMIFTDPPYDLEKNDWLNYLNSDKIFLMGSDKQQNIFYNNIKNFRHYFIMPFKNPTLISNNRPMQGHSLISFFCNGKTEFKNLRDGFSTLLSKDMGKSHSSSEKENYHKLGKPILLPQSFIEHYSNDKDLIYDFFLGAGSTLLAAEKTNRICSGIEIDPVFCEIIINRFYKYCLDNGKIFEYYLNNEKQIYNPE